MRRVRWQPHQHFKDTGHITCYNEWVDQTVADTVADVMFEGVCLTEFRLVYHRTKP